MFYVVEMCLLLLLPCCTGTHVFCSLHQFDHGTVGQRRCFLNLTGRWLFSNCIHIFLVCVLNQFVWTGLLLPDGGPGEVCEGHPQAAPGKLVGRPFQ
jgi:hypothetical protein